MTRFIRFSFGAALVAAATLATLLLLDQSNATANNPPTTVLGTAVVDPTEPAPTGAIGTDSTPVYETLEANGRYYLAGDFTTVGGQTRTGLAAIDVATGQVDPTFAPIITNGNNTPIVDAIAISPDGADLYVGGRFTQIDGTFRSRIAKLDAITGAVDPTFNPIVSAQVETIATDGVSVWAGGIFANVNGGVSAPNLAKFDATTGALDPNWVGTADARVRDIELDINNVLWVGGNFENIAGTATRFLAPLESATGNLLATWAPGPDVATPGVPLAEQNIIYDVSAAPDGSAVYVGTRGTPSSEPQGGNAVRKYDAGGELLWQVVGAGDTQALVATDSIIYVGGHGNFVYEVERFNLDGTPNNGVAGEDSNLNDTNFPTNGYVESDTNLNATRRNKLWALDPANGDLLDWDPNLDTTDGVWGIDTGPSGLLVSGDFRNIANPTGVTGSGNGVFSPHFVVFAGEGASGNAAPQPLFTFDCTGTTCDFDATASLDDGSITAYEWDFGDGQTALGSTATGINLADNAVHGVTLNVVDNAGLEASRIEQVIVGSGGLPIEHIATNNVINNFTQLQIPVPADSAAGDVAVAFVSVNTSAGVVNAPAGWTQVGDETDGNLRTFAFWRAVDAVDAGANQLFLFSDAQQTPLSLRANATLTVFRGADAANPIAAIGTTATPNRTAEHNAPSLSFTGDATILHYFAERTSNTTQIFASAELANLSTSIGTGGGYVNSTLAVDPALATSNSQVHTAITEHASTGAHGWSLALAEAVAPPDTTPPDTAITTPAVGQSTSGDPLVVTGTATDTESAIDSVFVRIVRLTSTPGAPVPTFQFWNGTNFEANPNNFLPATVTGNNWTYTTGTISPGGAIIQAYAVDTAGNIEQWADGRATRNTTITP